MKKLVFGGVHGNEWTGIYVLKDPEVIKCFGSENLVLANPEAHSISKRFVDEDLNRCFSESKLQETRDIYERSRAKEILETYKVSEMDYIVDLHTTNSNMGLTLIFHNNSKSFLRKLAALKKLVPELVFIYSPSEEKEHLFAHNENSFLIEAGPVVNNALSPQVYMQSKKCLLAINKVMEERLEASEPIEVFEFVKRLAYVYDESNNLISMVHEDIMDQDFKRLSKGDNLLRCFDGSIIKYDEDEDLYPMFINESAYYNYSFAMELTKKSIWKCE